MENHFKLKEFNTTFDHAKLLEGAKRQMRFLRKCHNLFGSQELENSLLSLNRYVQLWLPFLMKEAKERGGKTPSVDSDEGEKEETKEVKSGEQLEARNLAVPPDVAWIWHVHRLHPDSYIEFCVQLLNKQAKSTEIYIWETDEVLEKLSRSVYDKHYEEKGEPEFDSRGHYQSWHSDGFALKGLKSLAEFEFPQAVFNVAMKGSDSADLEETLVKWKAMYPEESFWVDDKETKLEMKSLQELGFVEDDIMKSMKSQRSFACQVDRDYYRVEKNLEIAVDDYLKFLNLTSVSEYDTIVPRIDIDLMWHTHMTTSPYSYARDCFDLVGHALGHDDTDNVSVDPKLLLDAYEKTGVEWKKAYDEEYHRPGSEPLENVPDSFWVSKLSEALEMLDIDC